MKVNTVPIDRYATPMLSKSASTTTREPSFSSALTEVFTRSTSPTHGDFTSMTRQEMFDWVNGQIRTGGMTVEASLPFRAMTMKVSADTGQSVDMASDSTRINFVDKARLGVEFALANRDPETARRLRAAMDIMLGQQGQVFGARARE